MHVSRASRRTLATLAVVWVGLVCQACALLVEEIEGTTRPKADAGELTDVGKSDHAAAQEEAGKGDGEASPDTGSADARVVDAKIVDAGIVDASDTDGAPRDATLLDGALDARPDATVGDAALDGRPEATPGDAAADGHRDSSITDAALDARLDAHPTGFCANYASPVDAAVFCDDFDEIPDANFFGSPTIQNGALTVQGLTSDSVPNALLFTADPADANVNQWAYLDHPLPTAKTFTLQYDFMISPFAATSGDVTGAGGFAFKNASGQLSTITLELNNPFGGAGEPTAQIKAVPPATDGGSPFHTARVTFNQAGWTRIVIMLSYVGGEYVETSFVSGVPLDQAVPLGAGFNEGNGAGVVDLGLSFVNQGGQRDLYIDNVVVSTQQ